MRFLLKIFPVWEPHLYGEALLSGRSHVRFPYKVSRVRTNGDGRLDGWSSTCNFYNCLARFRTMIGTRPNGWCWIRNFHIRTKLTDVPTVVFKLWFLPYVCARPEGNPRRPDGCINLHLFELGKKIWSWSIIGRRPEGCKLEQKLLDTVEGLEGNPRRPDEWCLVCQASGLYCTSSGRLELWTDERPDGMTRCLDWQGTDFFNL